MTESIECIVIGAGAIGLAIARRLALAGREVIVIEAADAIGTQTSSRNSEVIHAGIYYDQGSEKAKLCVAGKWQLYEFCESHGVGHKNCGKLIVATSPEEVDTLADIKLRAANNGVDDLYQIGADAVREMEPALACVSALMSPSTGIIDSHGLMLAFQGDAEDHGAMIAFESKVVGGEARDNNFQVRVQLAPGGEYILSCSLLVNSAGLGAQAVARGFAGLPPTSVPPLYYCKGSYFSLLGKQPFSRLIYPVPASASLGVHVTIDLAGQVRFGPDQEWVEDTGCDVDPRRAEVFYEAVRRYFPQLPDDALIPAYAGIRPKIQAPDEAGLDFMIQGPGDHGISGLVNLFGMESPGLTSSLAIADSVARLLETG